jgi:hypothetical protein
MITFKYIQELVNEEGNLDFFASEDVVEIHRESFTFVLDGSGRWYFQEKRRSSESKSD